MSGNTHFVIVYQFGKVASTSITNTLNALPGVEAYQSHFLGLGALTEMLSRVVNPNVSAYFHNHMLGQFIENVKLTHTLNSLLAGDDGRNLVVMTLSRAPLDWFRSAILQDLDGYASDFRSLSPDAADPIASGLTLMLRHVGGVISEHGGVEACLADIRARRQEQIFRKTALGGDRFLCQMFFLSLRPMLWFEQHFEPCLDVKLDDIPAEGRFWRRNEGQRSILVLRYEDLGEVFTDAMKSVGISVMTPIRHDNLSDAKPGANSVADAFQSPEAELLASLLHDCTFSRRFGYSPNHR